jgi:hypothetical protein
MAAAYQKVDLTTDEDNLFEAEWDKFVTRHFVVREASDIFADYKEEIKEAARIAKYQLEQPFGGVNARTNEFGWQPIMPNHLLATTTPTYATATWNQWLATSDVTTRWKDWIGSNSSHFKLSKYSTMIIVGFLDPVDVPKIDALRAWVKSIDYPIWYFADQMAEQDDKIIELAAPIILEKEQEMYIRQLVGRAGLSKLRPIGVMYSKGDYMRDESAYAKY